MTANALKIVPNNAIRFAAYEMLKGLLIVPRTANVERPFRASQGIKA